MRRKENNTAIDYTITKSDIIDGRVIVPYVYGKHVMLRMYDNEGVQVFTTSIQYDGEEAFIYLRDDEVVGTWTISIVKTPKTKRR